MVNQHEDEAATRAAKKREAIRNRAEAVKPFRCKNLIAVLEEPGDIKNLGRTIRNVNGLGVEKTYVVDPHGRLPDDWQEMRERKTLSKVSASAIKWSFVKRFDSTEACLAHLEANNYCSVVTSPHQKDCENAILHEADFTKYTKLAVWFGNEGRGISEVAVKRSELCVSIPMFGMIESLNLGTTTGIVLYEVTKQRRAYQERWKRGGHRYAKNDPSNVGKVSE